MTQHCPFRQRSLLSADAEMSGSTREVRAGQRVTMVTGPGLAYKGVLKGGGRTDREDYQMLRRRTERKSAEPAKGSCFYRSPLVFGCFNLR